MGVQQLPYTGNNPASEQLGNFSPSYSLVNAQVTRVFSKSLEVYVGVENLFNYQQERAILGADAPFGPNFDATIIYAPVFGRMVYTGLRYKVL
jgi:outer membrane receptor protein involved in Fe transport